MRSSGINAQLGSLPRPKRELFAGALAIALAWLACAVLVFFPGPRALFAALVIALPPISGVLVARAIGTRESLGPAMLEGYPLAAGLLAGFFVSLFTVPLERARARRRGLVERHVRLEPKPHREPMVIQDLSEACEMAGSKAVVGPAPRAIELPARALQRIAGSVVGPSRGSARAREAREHARALHRARHRRGARSGGRALAAQARRARPPLPA